MNEYPLPTTPQYSLSFDPIRERYVASDGTTTLLVRRPIGYSLIKKVEQELGQPQHQEGLQEVASLAARRMFKYAETFGEK